MHGFVSIDGARLEYAWHGPPPTHAPTLVFLHEGLGSISQWQNFPAEVCSRLGCGALVYNRCGHGKSDSLTGPRSPDFRHDEAMTEAPKLLELFEIRRPSLVAHTAGSTIAL